MPDATPKVLGVRISKVGEESTTWRLVAGRVTRAGLQACTLRDRTCIALPKHQSAPWHVRNGGWQRKIFKGYSCWVILCAEGARARRGKPSESGWRARRTDLDVQSDPPRRRKLPPNGRRAEEACASCARSLSRRSTLRNHVRLRPGGKAKDIGRRSRTRAKGEIRMVSGVPGHCRASQQVG